LSAQARKPRPWRGLLIPAVVLFALLVGLGAWQIQRKTWKEGLIAVLNERLAAPPSALPLPGMWPSLDQANDEYRRVKFSAAGTYELELAATDGEKRAATARFCAG